MEIRVLFVHALSPLHPGTGQAVGGVDLPVCRERATGIPYLPGSSLKGVLRDKARGRLDREKLLALFGPEQESASDHAGAAAFADARLLLLPVRSLAAVFACVTSPYLLERFVRDAELAGLKVPALPAAPGTLEWCGVAPGSRLRVTLVPVDGEDRGKERTAEHRVYLEDLDLTPSESTELKGWESWLAAATGAPVEGRLCLVHDDVMSFLMEVATEVRARIRLDDTTKTVAEGALWYEEGLPVETVLYSLVSVGPSWRKGTEVASADLVPLMGVVQLGGKATVGRGICRLRLGDTP